ncbi:D-TA family PLP-dependent enzyme [Spongiivirga citrea]|uniref:D-TA family PLP-dependent enzyme n=1 Tax=Spongiivirga citrea TaxID=1481457 RepID=A0A6M0CLY4_9FLAO|nr:D-TA family PLP-dependent enzyme [Spongiivirga citrea]NER18948.1 D-TA family PLP-dependent enzyme [Spongiivirga citrea]
MKPDWYLVNDTDDLVSPSLLVYPERIQSNIALMIAMAGGVDSLRPHIKTHKIAEIIQLQQEAGVYKFKCATIAEAELLGMCKAKDVLLAMQPVGAQMARFIQLIKKYPGTQFSTLVDNELTFQKLSSLARKERFILHLYIDINNGMNRTGIAIGNEAKRLFLAMQDDENIQVKGLHVYDGHIRDIAIEARTKRCNQGFEAVDSFRNNLKSAGISNCDIVLGGSPTFSIHCKREDVETSPGTTLLWDAGYAKYKDLSFLPAAVLFTRVISMPTAQNVCFDLGHKSVASEMPFPRVEFLTEVNGKQLSQSEEHLIVEHKENSIQIGDVAYALPIHICPTVAKYPSVKVVEKNKIIGSWKVAARDHKINI